MENTFMKRPTDNNKEWLLPKLILYSDKIYQHVLAPHMDSYAEKDLRKVSPESVNLDGIIAQEACDEILVAELRPFVGRKKKLYMGLDIICKSILPSFEVDRYLNEINVPGITSTEKLTAENLRNISVPNRNRILQDLPLTPWMHIYPIDAYPVDHGHFIVDAGLDIYKTTFMDDYPCNPGRTTFALPQYTQQQIKKMLSFGQLSKGGRDTYQTWEFDSLFKAKKFQPYEMYTPNDFLVSKRLSVPVDQTVKAYRLFAQFVAKEQR
jgi:hypothetical protein